MDHDRRDRSRHDRPTRPALRPALRARCVRRRVRRGRRRPVARPGPPARPGRTRLARPSRRVRRRRRIERRRRASPCPLDRTVLELLTGDLAGGRPGVVSVFLPRGRVLEAPRPALVETVFAEAGLPVAALARRPVRPVGARRGGRRLATRPSPRRSSPGPTRTDDDPRPLADDAFERRLVVARRRVETAAATPAAPRRARRPVRLVPRPSSTRAWSPAAGWPSSYPDLRAPLAVGYTVFHQRYATNTAPDLAAGPAVPLDRPQRRDQHGPRQSRAGPRPDCATWREARSPRDLLAAGPLLSPDGSDSLSLDEAPRAADVDRLGADPGTARRDPRGARRSAARRIRTSRRSAAGPPGSWHRGTGRPRSSSPTASGSARSSTATGCGPRRSR